jgi:hypothetical protein
MRAIKLHSYVEEDHTLNLRLPEDVREGPAEVIVLVPDEPGAPAHSLDDFLAGLLARRHRTRTTAEIDRDLERERESWE